MWRTPARLVERTRPGPASRTRVPAGTVVRSPKTTTPPARLETFRAATALRAAPGRSRACAAGAAEARRNARTASGASRRIRDAITLAGSTIPRACTRLGATSRFFTAGGRMTDTETRIGRAGRHGERRLASAKGRGPVRGLPQQHE